MKDSGRADFFGTLKDKAPWNYFEKRIRSATELKRLIPYQPVNVSEIVDVLNQPFKSGKRCLYIHIPFCTKSCSFCGYYKCVNPEKETIHKFVDALKKQINQLSKYEWVKSSPFNALYFGGGTPTALPAHLFFDLLETINENFPLAPDCEITLESTISELDDAFIERIPASKINRVSLGVQSFHENTRKQYSRKASPEKIQHKIDEIGKAGIANICIDLMYNLEGQKLEYWEHDLNTVRDSKITGCSVYPLLPFPNAPLVKSGNYKIPDPENEFNFFKIADDLLLAMNDWQPITCVQYGNKINGQAKYIELQTENADNLALGPGAGGKINGIQYLNAFSVDDYIKDNSFHSEKIKSFRVAEQDSRFSKKMEFFRKSYLSKNEFNEIFSEELLYEFLFHNSLATESENQIKLSQTGKYWAINLAEMAIKS